MKKRWRLSENVSVRREVIDITVITTFKDVTLEDLRYQTLADSNGKFWFIVCTNSYEYKNSCRYISSRDLQEVAVQSKNWKIHALDGNIYCPKCVQKITERR